MNAKEFYQRFITAIHNDKPHAEEIYQKSSLYTPYVKNIIGKILGNADPLNHIEVNHEYYRVDVFAWKRAEGRMLSKKPSEIFGSSFGSRSRPLSTKTTAIPGWTK